MIVIKDPVSGLGERVVVVRVRIRIQVTGKISMVFLNLLFHLLLLLVLQDQVRIIPIVIVANLIVVNREDSRMIGGNLEVKQALAVSISTKIRDIFVPVRMGQSRDRIRDVSGLLGDELILITRLRGLNAKIDDQRYYCSACALCRCSF